MTLPTQQINQFITTYFTYLAVGLVIVMTILFWQFLLRPQYRAIQESGILQYDSIAQTLADRKIYVQQLQNMKQEYDQFDRRSLRYVDVALPEEYSQADAFAEVNALFEGTDLAVQSMNVAALTNGEVADATDAAVDPTVTVTPTAPSGYEVVLITVNVTARQIGVANDSGSSALSYTDFKRILQKIEQHQHLLNLDQLVYAPDSNAFTLILKTYQRVSEPTDL